MTPRKVLVKMVTRRMEVASHYHTFPRDPPFERVTELVRKMRYATIVQEYEGVPNAIIWFLGGYATGEDYLKFADLQRVDMTDEVLREGYDAWLASSVMEV